MFDKIGTIEASGQGTVRAQTTTASASKPESGDIESVVSAPLSPRMKADPEAGVMVLEYISDNGDMTMQVPSRTVVAYLRSGLSEAGLPVPDDFQSVNKDA